MRKERPGPYKGFNYRLRFADDPLVIAGFAEVSGLGEKSSGKTPVTLRFRRGLFSRASLSALSQTRRALAPSRVLTLSLHSETQDNVASWQLSNPVITKWQGPSFNAESGEVPVDELEISAEGIQISSDAAV